MRLDQALVARGLISSRTKAARAIAAGRVFVAGKVTLKASLQVTDAVNIEITIQNEVSRAEPKLRSAFLEMAVPSPAGKVAVDAGSSTGGFTRVLLDLGAAKVIGFDVGHDQLDSELRADGRVEQHDGVNLRTLPAGFKGVADLVVADLSFISASYVLPTLAALTHTRGDVIYLVKPQFEVGRERLGAGGIVSPVHWQEAIMGVMRHGAAVGLQAQDVIAAPITGTHGNQEFVVWFSCRTNTKSVPVEVPHEVIAKVATVVHVRSERP